MITPIRSSYHKLPVDRFRSYYDSSFSHNQKACSLLQTVYDAFTRSNRLLVSISDVSIIFFRAKFVTLTTRQDIFGRSRPVEEVTGLGLPKASGLMIELVWSTLLSNLSFSHGIRKSRLLLCRLSPMFLLIATHRLNLIKHFLC